MWYCTACTQNSPRSLNAALRHQQTITHQTKARAYVDARTRSGAHEPQALASSSQFRRLSDDELVPTINRVDFDALGTDFDAHLDMSVDHLAQMSSELNRWLEDDIISLASSSSSDPDPIDHDDEHDDVIPGKHNLLLLV